MFAALASNLRSGYLKADKQIESSYTPVTYACVSEEKKKKKNGLVHFVSLDGVSFEGLFLARHVQLVDIDGEHSQLATARRDFVAFVRTTSIARCGMIKCTIPFLQVQAR
jgi:hypothetical protein